MRIEFVRAVVVLLMSLMATSSIVSADGVPGSNILQPDTPVTIEEIVTLLELQYQISLNLPYDPSTDASLAGLDMAISGVKNATPEALAILQSATPQFRVMHANLQEFDDAIRARKSQSGSTEINSLASSTATFDCDGYVELEGELERPPGPCNESDTQVDRIDYLPFGSDGELFLSDNVYPNYPFCNANIPPENIRNLLIASLVAEQVKFLADRACKQALFFFASGGNAELACIVTDLINHTVQQLYARPSFCNDIRSASEGRTSYVRSGELFVQRSENTQYVDRQLINGFGDLNGEIQAIQDQACDNAVRLNQQIGQLNETLRSIRISNARLLDLFGDQLDPIDPVPLPTPDCVPQAVAETNPTVPVLPPVQPVQPVQPEPTISAPPSAQPTELQDEISTGARRPERIFR